MVDVIKLKKYKRFFVILFVILDVIVLGLVVVKFNLKISLIGDKDIYLNVNGNYFENGYKATFFGKAYDKVIVSNNVDATKLGDYEVIYKVKYYFIQNKVKRSIHVVDKEKPAIELTGDTYLYLEKDSEYAENGYTATDNYDGNLTDKVIVESNLDTSKVGKYQIKYIVTDSANNENEVTRDIEVINAGLLSTNIENFWLKGSFEDVILKYEEKEYDYFDKIVFVGDSNTTYLYKRGNFINNYQAWSRNNLNIGQINSSTFTTFSNNQESTFENAIKNQKPSYLIISTGINSPLYVNKDDYIRETEAFIKNMKTNHSDIKFAFTSILPITNGTISVAAQKKINQYNYYLLELCHKHKVNFINFSDEIRSSTTGFGVDKYFDCFGEDDCGFHLSNEGKEKYIDYIKHVNLEREIL